MLLLLGAGQLSALLSGCPCARLLPLHLSEQYLTSSQTFSHFLRQVNGLPHVKHTLLGRSDLFGALTLPAPFLTKAMIGNAVLRPVAQQALAADAGWRHGGVQDLLTASFGA
jgi:hypothetical protein